MLFNQFRGDGLFCCCDVTEESCKLRFFTKNVMARDILFILGSCICVAILRKIT